MEAPARTTLPNVGDSCSVSAGVSTPLIARLASTVNTAWFVQLVFSDGKIIGCTCNIHYQNRLVTYDIIYQNNEELKRYA